MGITQSGRIKIVSSGAYGPDISFLLSLMHGGRKGRLTRERVGVIVFHLSQSSTRSCNIVHIDFNISPVPFRCHVNHRYNTLSYKK